MQQYVITNYLNRTFVDLIDIKNKKTHMHISDLDEWEWFFRVQ